MALRRAGAFGLAFVVAKCSGDASCDAAQLVQGSARVQPAAELNVGLSKSDLLRAVGPAAEELLGRKVNPEDILHTMDRIKAEDTPPIDLNIADPLPAMVDSKKDFEQLQARVKTFLQEGEILPPRKKVMSMLEEMSEKHQELSMSDDWQEKMHEAMMGTQEWLRQPEVMDHLIGMLPGLRELLQKPDFTQPSRGVAALLETGSARSAEATAVQMMSNVGHSIHKMAAAVNSTMGNTMGDYPPLGSFSPVTTDFSTNGVKSKLFAEYNWAVYPVDDTGYQVDFGFKFEDVVMLPTYRLKLSHIGAITSVGLQWRTGRGGGYGAKVEVVTDWLIDEKRVVVVGVAFSGLLQTPPLFGMKTRTSTGVVSEPVGTIKMGGGMIYKYGWFSVDAVPKVVLPISMEHTTVSKYSPNATFVLASPTNATEIRFTYELGANSFPTSGLLLYKWDVSPALLNEPFWAVRLWFKYPLAKRVGVWW